MSDLYYALCTQRTEHRAALICAIKVILDDNGFEDMLAVKTQGLVYNTEIDGRVDMIEAAIIQCGCNYLIEAGIYVDYDVVLAQPDILLEIISTVFSSIDNWEDYESVYDMIASETIFGLSTVIATVSGTLSPSKYVDAITQVEDRVYKTLIKFVELKIKEYENENPERRNSKIVELIREFCSRCPTNIIATIYTSAGIDLTDDSMMLSVEYELEPNAAQIYYRNMSETIAGLILRRCEYYGDAYELIGEYAEALVDSEDPKVSISITKAASAFLKDIYHHVETAEDEKIRTVPTSV